MYRISSFLAVCLGCIAGCAPQFQGSHYLEHIAYLASDDLEGRGVGTPGIAQAGAYIARQFKEAGLEPAGSGGTYFQPFDVTIGQEIKDSSLSIEGVSSQPVAGKDYVPLPFTANDDFAGPLAFAGYGVSAKAEKYDDYEDFDAKGKVLLMFRYEPHAEDTHASFGGSTPSVQAAFRTKASLAKKQGAKAILIVNPPLHHGQEDLLYAFDSVGRMGDYGIPMMHVSRDFAQRLLRAGGAGDLSTLQEDLDGKRKSRSMDLKELQAKGHPGLTPKTVEARNVIGLIRGEGPTAGEYVVIGAHYDHLGKVVPRRPTGKEPANEPRIHNGADDNASGTSGVIELARAIGPRGSCGRSILIMAFSGEESGLLGSDYYVNHPTVPVKKIVAMLNMDMIGRLRNNKLDVYGVDTATHVRRLIERQAGLLGFELKATSGSAGPSDHMPFFNKQIPALHFFTGMHDEYHLPSDDTATINAGGGARVVQFVYAVAQSLVNAPARPTYVAIAGAGKKAAPQSNIKVKLGVMPSYVDDNERGLKIEGTSPGSAAERAGLHQGDRITSIGTYELNDVYGLADALNHYRPGDTADIAVLRNGQKVTAKVKFEAAQP